MLAPDCGCDEGAGEPQTDGFPPRPPAAPNAELPDCPVSGVADPKAGFAGPLMGVEEPKAGLPKLLVAAPGVPHGDGFAPIAEAPPNPGVVVDPNAGRAC